MRSKILALVLGTLAVTGFGAAPASATPITLALTYSAADLSGLSGAGLVTFDDSLLGASLFTLESPPISLTAFSLTVSGLPGPTSTTFGLGDLSRWVLDIGAVGGVGGIINLNFFMSGSPANGDDFSIEGGDVFFFMTVCSGPSLSCIGGDVLGVIELTSIEVARAVPEPAAIGLLCAGLAGLGLARRRRAAA